MSDQETTFTLPNVQEQLAQFSPSDAAIAKLSEEYLPLRIDGLADAKGYAIVRAARMDVRGKRLKIEKLRKDKKADALSYGRVVDAEAKRMTALLEPIESHLLAEEKAIDEEKDRIKNAKKRAEEAEAQAKIDARDAELKRLQDEAAARLKAEQDAEAERLRVEREKLEAEREELRKAQEAEAAKQREAQETLDAQQREIDAENKRLADIEAGRLRAEDLEAAKVEAAEKARVETEERIAREKEEEATRVKEEEAARLRAESLRPEKEKLIQVVTDIAAINIPEVSPEYAKAADQIGKILVECEVRIAKVVSQL